MGCNCGKNSVAVRTRPDDTTTSSMAGQNVSGVPTPAYPAK